MPSMKFKAKALNAFLSSFGAVAEDLLVTLSAGGVMEAEVAFQTYYLRRKELIPYEGKEDSGTFYISDLDKTRQFIKRCKSEFVTLKQTGSGKTLFVIAGRSKVQFPTSTSIISASRASIVAKMFQGYVDSKETMFANKDVSTSGSLDLSDLMSIKAMSGILDSSPVFEVTVNPSEKEFVIRAGKAHEARYFASAPVSDAVGDKVKANYGAWFIETVPLLNPSQTKFNVGESAPLILMQSWDSGEATLIVVDQRA